MTLPTVKVGDKDLTVTQMLAHRKNRLNEMLPEGCGITGDQLFRIAQMEIMRNPDLAQCDPNSVMNAIYDSARLGLLIGREAHLVPFAKKMSDDSRLPRIHHPQLSLRDRAVAGCETGLPRGSVRSGGRFGYAYRAQA